MFKYFASQQEDEKILLVKRRHGITFFPLLFLGLIFYCAGLTIFFVLPYYLPVLDEGVIPNFLIVIVSLFFLYATLFFFIEWMLFHLHIGILTDKRVVDVDQKSLFSRRIAEMSLGNLEDITGTQKGVIQTMLHFGNVEIQTAAEMPNFVFEMVSDPYGTQRAIMGAMEEFKRTHNINR